ncbi:hypothetical protein LX32DRAFT_642218 [Colletotrichum zoysiae]|uniref:Uncharacterized protein n=1 Tax=Colletotrichum zoysiae TaxID=1216348 RepID=A0AAD9HDA3_9PEZI|nr:hypothetical protein LX32DRAFT_642218 [Colletotrichum zoysiae]
MMPSRRPLKRPVEVVESPQDRLEPASVKLPRLEKEPEEFLQIVKTKLQSNSRTGQACDRCKTTSADRPSQPPRSIPP